MDEQETKPSPGPKILKIIVVGLAVIGLLLAIGYYFLRPALKFNSAKAPAIVAAQPGVPNKSNWNAPNNNEILYAENLPACQGTELFSSSPVDLSTVNSLSPLGHTSSYNGIPAHVFPVDHMSFDLKHVLPGDRTSTSLPATLLSPGDVEVFHVSHTTYERDGKVIGNDYAIQYAPCREVTGGLGHVTTISQKIQDAIDHTDQKNCLPPFTTGGNGSPTFNTCVYSILLNLKSGEQIGTAGGPADISNTAFDYSTYDMRIPPLPFIDPKYWTPQNTHAICGLKYYPNGPVKDSMYNKLDTTSRDTTGRPDCGTNMWDKAGTAQGNWVLEGTPVTGKVPDTQGLAVVHLFNDPNQSLIDWGDAIAPADRMQAHIVGSGRVDRDPADIRADGKVYCFQDDTQTPGHKNDHGIKMQLVNDNILKVEYMNGVCPEAPMLDNPTIYVR